MDVPDALHYVDPPYPIGVRAIGNGTTPEHRYRHEMTDDDHVRLAELLSRLQGMVIISSYPGSLYDELFRGWQRIGWTGGQFCGLKSGSRTRTECVWLNQAASDGLRQQSLFLTEAL
jgi:DNA adenine methylase